MDIGLYTLKLPFRKLIGSLLPPCKNISPNTISWALIPVGVGTAYVYVQALRFGCDGCLLLGIALGFLRMVVATLDGLVAVTYGKSTCEGDLINRLTPELCDLMLYPTLLWATGHLDLLGLIVLTMAWATSFFGLLGTPSGCPPQSVGPVGQTDRLATLMLFSFFEFLGRKFQWEIKFFDIFFYWLIIGGVITLILRFVRHLRAVRKQDQRVSS